MASSVAFLKCPVQWGKATGCTDRDRDETSTAKSDDDGQNKSEWTASSLASALPESSALNIIANEALGSFGEQCEPLMNYANDWTFSKGFRFADSSLTTQREYKWEKSLWITVNVAQDASSIPKNFYANGHSCHYEISLGPRAGISTAKKPCKRLCDICGDDGYVRLPRLIGASWPEEP